MYDTLLHTPIVLEENKFNAFVDFLLEKGEDISEKFSLTAKLLMFYGTCNHDAILIDTLLEEVLYSDEASIAFPQHTFKVVYEYFYSNKTSKVSVEVKDKNTERTIETFIIY